MLLNCPVRQRLWSHGNMALYKFCIVLYCEVDSVRVQILLIGTRRQCGSRSVAGHNHRKVIGRDPHLCKWYRSIAVGAVQQAPEQMRAASHRDPTEEDQHRLVPRCVRRQFGNLQNTAPSFSVELCPQFKDFEKFCHCMSSVASIINLVQSAKKSVNIWHGYRQKGGLRRALSSTFSSVLAMRTKCTRQPPSCF